MIVMVPRIMMVSIILMVPRIMIRRVMIFLIDVLLMFYLCFIFVYFWCVLVMIFVRHDVVGYFSLDLKVI